MTPTERIIAFAQGDHVLPPSVRADAERLLADTLAVGAAGRGAPGEAAIVATARAMGSGGDARLIGEAARLPAAAAAFVNGYRIHCLEWDAVHEGAVVHALSVVTAALGGAIDRRGGIPADEALAALAVGVDIACGLGIAADTPLRFFRPATAGLMGAAAAVARVERVPVADAFGLAHASIAGTMQAHAEGSIALPFQIANAARAAIVAVDLARAGFPAPRDVFEGTFGYFPLFDDGDLAPYAKTLGERWRIGEVSTKPCPSGRASHALLGALADLHLAAEHVASITLRVPPLVARLVGRAATSAMTPAHARLCAPFLAALMLTDGRIDPRRFTPETFADPALLDLAARVTLVDDGNTDLNALAPQHLTVVLRDGGTIERAIPATLGAPDAPLSPGQAAAKRDLARALAGDIADPRLFDAPLAYFTEPR